MKAIDNLLTRLSGIKESGDGWVACCPVHEDKNPSLSIKTGEEGCILLKCHAGCQVEQIVNAIDLKMSDLFPPRTNTKGTASKAKIVEHYNYTDENGVLLFQCLRYQPKTFRQRRPDPDKPGKWIWNLNGVRRVLYHLPDVKAALLAGKTIYVVEGEKDCDALVKLGFAATCNPMGAGKWLPEHTESLRGAEDVVVVADKDKPGIDHAHIVAKALLGAVKNVKLIQLPDRDGHKVKDVSDFIDAGARIGDLQALVDAAPEFVPAEAESRVCQQDRSGVENDSPYKEDAEMPVRKSAATRLVQFAEEFAFFHDPQSRAFVRLDVSGHVEVWPVNSSQFRKLLAQMYYQRTHTAVNRNALADAVATLEGRAFFDSPEEPVFLRVAPHGENLLIDLCDQQWRVAEVTPTGWCILDKSPVAFFRTSAMRPLPQPAPATQGSLAPLWEFLNVTPAQRPLVAGALLNYFHPDGPYFVTNLVGEQGSAKSCGATMVRSCVDPNEIPLRSPPRDERDLLVQAANNRCVVLDNLSALPAWLSDGLCRLSTGGGHSARQLYSDGEEFTLAVKRPVILTGIDDVATRPDLAERALQIELETIPDNRRMSEKELWQKFEQARPVIFSAILGGLVCALRELPNVRIGSLPRMADAALWATAGETAFGWSQGTFIAAYQQNLNEGAIASLDAHPVGVAIRQLLDAESEWTGEPARLLASLNDSVSEEQRHAQNWPKTPRTLSSCLRRLAQALRRAGIDLEFRRSRRRTIRLCKRADFASPASPASQNHPAADANDANDANLLPLHEQQLLVEEFA